MKVQVKFSALKETKWYEYAARFLLGGFVTAIAGAITVKFGPVVGGLFLAFPAIFPASATLVEKHESKRKEKLGLNGKRRGREASGADATGAALGTVGLLVFGTLVWLLLPKMSSWLVLTLATLAWFGIAVLVWIIRKRI